MLEAVRALAAEKDGGGDGLKKVSDGQMVVDRHGGRNRAAKERSKMMRGACRVGWAIGISRVVLAAWQGLGGSSWVEVAWGEC